MENSVVKGSVPTTTTPTPISYNDMGVMGVSSYGSSFGSYGSFGSSVVLSLDHRPVMVDLSTSFSFGSSGKIR